MTSVTVHQEADLIRFRAQVTPMLSRQEAADNLFFGLLGQMTPETPPSVMALVLNSEDIVLAALQTDPQHNLILSHGQSVAAVRLLAETLFQEKAALPGVIGPRDLACEFAEAWSRVSRSNASLIMQERIYQATTVIQATRHVPGMARWATELDIDPLISWIDAFIQEAAPGSPRGDVRSMLERRIAAGHPEGGYLLWAVDHHLVSLAGYGSPTPHGVRVGPVYTPPRFRTQGYASAAVSALTENLLESGYQFVFLFTDLANPTSNAIYQRIGYRPVSDVDQYQFTPHR